MTSRTIKIGAGLAAILLVAGGVAYLRFTREIPVRLVGPAQNVEVRVFGIGTIEAQIVSKVGFQVAGKVVAVGKDGNSYSVELPPTARGEEAKRVEIKITAKTKQLSTERLFSIR